MIKLLRQEYGRIDNCKNKIIGEKMKKIAKRKIFVIMIILLMLLGLTSIFYVEKKDIYKNINNEKKEANELLSSEIETTYVVNSIEGETINVTITIKNKIKIAPIATPNS